MFNLYILQILKYIENVQNGKKKYWAIAICLLSIKEVEFLF